jgi:opacity protein-like surface antigen
MNTFKKLIATSFLLISTHSAQAHDWYFGALYSEQEVESNEFIIGNEYDSVGLIAGFQFNDYYAIEARFNTGISDESYEVVTADGIGLSTQSIDSQTSILLKASYPSNSKFKFYAIAGYAETEIEDTLTYVDQNFTRSSTGTYTMDGFTYGIGGGLKISPQTSLFIEYQVLHDLDTAFFSDGAAFSSSQKWDSVNFGLTHKF